MGMKHETHDVWGTQLYWGTIGLRRRTELYHANPTFEIDEKLRWGISHILRIPFTPFGFVFGKWQETCSGSEEEAILKALSGRDLKEDEWTKQQARVTVAKRSTSLDDEWKLVDALGLAE